MHKAFLVMLMGFAEVVILAAVILGSGGCSRFTEQYAIIVAYNSSGDTAVMLVNGGEVASIPASGSIRREIPILVPANPVNQQGGPSSVDKTVEISVAFHNLRTHRLTSPAICRAGAKVITTVSYRVYPGNDIYDYAPQCTSSY